MNPWLGHQQSVDWCHSVLPPYRSATRFFLGVRGLAIATRFRVATFHTNADHDAHPDFSPPRPGDQPKLNGKGKGKEKKKGGNNAASAGAVVPPAPTSCCGSRSLFSVYVNVCTGGRLHVFWVFGRQRRCFLGMGHHVSTHSATAQFAERPEALEVGEGSSFEAIRLIWTSSLYCRPPRWHLHHSENRMSLHPRQLSMCRIWHTCVALSWICATQVALKKIIIKNA